MKKPICSLSILAFVVFVAVSVNSGELGAVSDFLDGVSDMGRAADRTSDAFEDLRQNRSRYEYDEDRRVHEMARHYGRSPREIKRMRRDGYDWEEIESRHGRRHYRHDDWDREIPPGLAKKGGMPPGQTKKYHHRYHH